MVKSSQSCFSQGKLDRTDGHHLEPVCAHRAHSKCPFLEGRSLVLQKVFPEAVQVQEIGQRDDWKERNQASQSEAF